MDLEQVVNFISELKHDDFIGFMQKVKIKKEEQAIILKDANLDSAILALEVAIIIAKGSTK